jgi:predicted metal-dependent phosphoesterase TrpH
MTQADVYADLHMHTTCSDGCYSPTALVERAAERGIQVLSVTDHDTVEGLEPAATAARACGLRFVPGIELSVTLEGEEIHLLAYDFDPDHNELERHLRVMQDARRDRAQTMVERLREHGAEVMDERLQEDIASTHAVGRPHVAAALVRAEQVATDREAFERYLGRGKPAYVAKPAFAASDALNLVHEAGGMGILAHPGHWTSSAQIRRLVEAGLDGLETIHPSHDASLRGYYERLARGYDLAMTGGSDYHGRREDEESHFGSVGMNQSDWERFQTVRP